ncbi:MAG: PQQ-binding-like beta-propeller repeat protein, partial [Planctomycetota bacterium]|nr:PQQ-binding-like beta-propeller repeat protein [Planctomycetota bacterium]
MAVGISKHAPALRPRRGSHPRARSLLLFVAVCLVVAAAAGDSYRAQQTETGPSSDLYIETGTSSSFLQRVERLRREERWTEYTDLCLETATSAKEELCYVGEGHYRSLADIALEKLAGSPKSTLGILLKRRESLARSLLDRAVGRRDRPLLERLALELSYVPAGLEGVLLLVKMDLESGEVSHAASLAEATLAHWRSWILAGVSNFLPELGDLVALKAACETVAVGRPRPGPWERTGIEAERGAAEDRLADQFAGAQIRVCGADKRLDGFYADLVLVKAGTAGADSGPGKDDWPAPGGDNTRAAAVDIVATRPLLTWRVDFARPAPTQQTAQQQEVWITPDGLLTSPQSSARAWPVLPSIARGNAYIALGATLHAVEIATGSRLWTYPPIAGGSAKAAGGGEGLLENSLIRTGSCVSGQRVFATLCNPGSGRSSVVACDLATGRLVWEAGDREGASEDGERLMFIGPPLTASNRVFAVATGMVGQEHQVFVVCLSARDGKPLWKRFVCARTSGIDGWGRRTFLPGVGRDSALAEATGTILLGSELGALAAIDAVSGEILWLWDLTEVAAKPPLPGPQQPSLAAANVMNFPIVVDGVCYYFCSSLCALTGVDLSSGRRVIMQSVPNGGELEACVAGRAIITGNGIHAYDLATGGFAWESAEEYASTGRGFATTAGLFVASHPRGMLVLNCGNGKLVCETKWEIGGRSAGNLTAGAGAILAADSTSLRCYVDWPHLQARYEERLGRTPPDSEAYADRANVLALNGYYEEALRDLTAFLGTLAGVSGQEEKRRAALERLAGVCLAWGKECEAKGMRDEALKAYRQGVDSGGKTACTTQLLVRMLTPLIKSQSWQEACDRALQLIAIDPTMRVETPADDDDLVVPSWTFAANMIKAAISGGGEEIARYVEAKAAEYDGGMGMLQFCSIFSRTDAARARFERRWKEATARGDHGDAAATAATWWRTCPDKETAPAAVAALAQSLAGAGDSVRLKDLLRAVDAKYPDARIGAESEDCSLSDLVRAQLEKAVNASSAKPAAASNSFPGELVTAFDMKKQKKMIRPPLKGEILVPDGIPAPQDMACVFVTRGAGLEYWSLLEARCLWVLAEEVLSAQVLLAAAYVGPSRVALMLPHAVLCVDTVTGKVCWRCDARKVMGFTTTWTTGQLASATGTVVVIGVSNQERNVDLVWHTGELLIPARIIALDLACGDLLWQCSKMLAPQERDPTATTSGTMAAPPVRFFADPMSPLLLLHIVQPRSDAAGGRAGRRAGRQQQQLISSAIQAVDVRTGEPRQLAATPARQVGAVDDTCFWGFAPVLGRAAENPAPHLAFFQHDKKLVAWNLHTAQQEWGLVTYERPRLMGIVPHEDGLLTSVTTGALCCYRATTGRVAATSSWEQGCVPGAIVNVDGEKGLIAVAYDDPSVRAQGKAIFSQLVV